MHDLEEGAFCITQQQLGLGIPLWRRILAPRQGHGFHHDTPHFSIDKGHGPHLYTLHFSTTTRDLVPITTRPILALRQGTWSPIMTRPILALRQRIWSPIMTRPILALRQGIWSPIMTRPILALRQGIWSHHDTPHFGTSTWDILLIIRLLALRQGTLSLWWHAPF